MTKKQEKRFYEDMKDPIKQEAYRKFVEREQEAFKAMSEKRKEDNGG